MYSKLVLFLLEDVFAQYQQACDFALLTKFSGEIACGQGDDSHYHHLQRRKAFHFELEQKRKAVEMNIIDA